MTEASDNPSPLPFEPGLWRRFRTFSGRVVSKAAEDNIFFMAGAITFNLLVALIPLLLLVIGISGFVLTSRFPDPASTLITYVFGDLPTVGGTGDVLSRLQGILDAVLADRESFSIVGLLFLAWISTRLVGTLRTALREIFDFPSGRGIIQGKLFDSFMVIVGGLLFIVNIGITVAVETLEEMGTTLAGLQGPWLVFLQETTAQALAFVSIWVLFLLVYRYLPPKRIPWRTAFTAATFTGILFEATKYLFSWYVTNVANFTTLYGGLTSAAVLFFWTYYGSIVFILGGEVAQVYTMSRTRRLHASRGLSG